MMKDYPIEFEFFFKKICIYNSSFASDLGRRPGEV